MQLVFSNGARQPCVPPAPEGDQGFASGNPIQVVLRPLQYEDRKSANRRHRLVLCRRLPQLTTGFGMLLATGHGFIENPPL